MRTRIMASWPERALGLITLLVCFGMSSQTVYVQNASPSRVIYITHVAVVVREVERSSRLYAEALGLDPPKFSPRARPFQAEIPSSADTEPLRGANFDIRNFRFELQQPLDTSGPMARHLERFSVPAF